MYPDTADMLKALHGILYTFGQAERFVREGTNLDADYFYTITSGMQLLKLGILESARDRFMLAQTMGPGYGELFYLTGLLYLAADSLETGNDYLEMARNAGFKFRDSRPNQGKESKSTGFQEKD